MENYTQRHQYGIVGEMKQDNTRKNAIYLVERKDNGGLYISKTGRGKVQTLLIYSEILALRRLNHPNIAKMVDSSLDLYSMLGKVYLEYYEAGDLKALIEEQRMTGKLFQFDTVREVFTNICAALAYCHHGIRTPDANPAPDWNPIIHRDLKTDNIFLRRDNSVPGGLVAVLGDFGWSTEKYTARHDPRAPTGDPNWIAPEAPNTTAQSDVYGLSLIIGCMTQLAMLPRELRNGDGPDRWAVPQEYGKRMNVLVIMASEPSPSRRPNSQELSKELSRGW
ncbi:ATPase-like ParA/MinD [Macrophomina phaseolina MS6]|uniref:non-specific serine/threonine protein kinase n=1 Tax=Macrophomina phaseolina (strain MS6) TaxID=1126212 RepID=K2QNI4_MACPH|nr:ATPase-like ParA/MinD [Macrophomina phaseolina MS6]